MHDFFYPFFFPRWPLPPPLFSIRFQFRWAGGCNGDFVVQVEVAMTGTDQLVWWYSVLRIPKRSHSHLFCWLSVQFFFRILFFHVRITYESDLRFPKFEGSVSAEELSGSATLLVYDKILNLRRRLHLFLKIFRSYFAMYTVQ